ncbi:amidohydrolase family protein [Paenibacillus sp. MCAF20]
MATLLIRNARNIITMDADRNTYPGGSLYADGHEIKAIGLDIPYDTADTVIDAAGKIVYPGLINTHHHLYQTFTRNIPWAQDVELFDWLLTLYDIWRHMRPEDVYLSAMVGLGELLKTGCTTASDHFYCFPNGISGELIDEEIRAAAELGIRFFPTRGSMNLGRSQGGLPPDEVTQSMVVILKDTQRVIESYHDASKFGMVRVGVAPCSPFSVSEDLLRESAVLARSYKGNMKLASGIFPLADMLKVGVHVGLGVDGSASNDASNLLGEVRQAYLLHKLSAGKQSPTAAESLWLGTVGSSRVLGWEDAIGSLEVGKAADLFMIDTRKLEYAGALFDDTALPVVTGISQNVDMTVVGGKVVVKDGQLVHVNEQRLAVSAQAAALRMLETAAKHTGANYYKQRGRG